MAAKFVKLTDLHNHELLVKADAVNFVAAPHDRSKKARAFVGIGNGFAVLETPDQIKAKLKKAGATIVDDD